MDTRFSNGNYYDFAFSKPCSLPPNDYTALISLSKIFRQLRLPQEVVDQILQCTDLEGISSKTRHSSFYFLDSYRSLQHMKRPTRNREASGYGYLSSVETYRAMCLTLPYLQPLLRVWAIAIKLRLKLDEDVVDERGTIDVTLRKTSSTGTVDDADKFIEFEGRTVHLDVVHYTLDWVREKESKLETLFKRLVFFLFINQGGDI